MDASDVWVTSDDGSEIVRAAAITGVRIGSDGVVAVRLGHGEATTVMLAKLGGQDGARPGGDFHRQLISVIAQLSDASGAFLVKPVHDEARGWRWLSEPL
jgi:hypothetical protein